jgi:hypothetical protein
MIIYISINVSTAKGLGRVRNVEHPPETFGGADPDFSLTVKEARLRNLQSAAAFF